MNLSQGGGATNWHDKREKEKEDAAAEFSFFLLVKSSPGFPGPRMRTDSSSS